MSSANQHQVGGDHYQALVQHWDWVEAHGLGYLEGCATKYVTRWRKKDGVQGLMKARHYVEKLHELATSNHQKRRENRSLHGVSILAMHMFSEANGLTGDERVICDAIANWRAPDDLLTVLQLLDALIATDVGRTVRD